MAVKGPGLSVPAPKSGLVSGWKTEIAQVIYYGIKGVRTNAQKQNEKQKTNPRQMVHTKSDIKNKNNGTYTHTHTDIHTHTLAFI